MLRELTLLGELLLDTVGGSVLLKFAVDLLGDRTERGRRKKTSPSGTVVLVLRLLFARRGEEVETARGCLYTRVPE